MRPIAIPFPFSLLMKKSETGKWTDPLYSSSFDIVECPDGSTFRTLLDKLDVSLASSEIHFIRGNEDVHINKGDVDFPLCDGDILHITDTFSLAKRFLG